MTLTSSVSAPTTTKTLIATSAVTWVSARMTMGSDERTSTAARCFMIQHHTKEGLLEREYRNSTCDDQFMLTTILRVW